ncbi:hypothetical protein HDA32_004590 [Spinactinospora alkalitolerans]|uniref:PIN domain-containing protein n=1 Tax=Spinactinospora alkalitolerans TaxID=687207 RepID=A0A852U6D2_9ACTN|nr:hypothetical protein [Spinactinospora alkalitolerans]NYE49470.1 hypothetical protein [Spinactinospora alkalitolerans]
MIGYILDAGALIALERRKDFVLGVLDRARERDEPLLISAAVLGQVWRDTPEQAPVNSLLKLRTTEVLPLDWKMGRRIGRALRLSGTSDVVDAHVSLLARDTRWPVLTSDPGDLRKLYPEMVIREV